MKKHIVVSLLILAMVMSWSCSGEKPEVKLPKNIIVLVADGMGPQQLSLLYLYAKHAPRSSSKEGELHLETLVKNGHTAIMMTNPKNAITVDSAAAASQMATGSPMYSETISFTIKSDKSDPNFFNKKDPAEGARVDTILELAKKLGKATALISNTRITHATPAAFAAHTSHRSHENQIAGQLLENGVDVMLAGGLRHWVPKGFEAKTYNAGHPDNKIPEDMKLTPKQPQGTNLLDQAKEKGYSLAFDRRQMEKVKSGKLLGLFANAKMPDELKMRNPRREWIKNVPTLSHMTTHTLSILEQDPDGFFLMVEEGLIDEACHVNDAGMLLHQMINLEATLGTILKWLEGRDDTLLILVSDHETGGFGFSYSKTGIQAEDRILFNFGSFDILDKIYNQKRSYLELLDIYDNEMEKNEKTPERFAQLVNENLEFDITIKDAQRILKMYPNRYHVPGHSYQKIEESNETDDFQEFYVYGTETRGALIARAIASRQMTVWGSGTHTATPVLAVALGAGSSSFKGIINATDFGRLLKKAAGF
jgi:alkaline phosphatase